MHEESQPIRTFRDLIAWQKAYALGLSIHRLTRTFPAEERFGLTSQLRRAGVSIASNIAEGYGRGGRPDYVRFLKMARGSLYEADTQLSFSLDFGYVQPDEHGPVMSQLQECERVLAGLIRALESEA